MPQTRLLLQISPILLYVGRVDLHGSEYILAAEERSQRGAGCGALDLKHGGSADGRGEGVSGEEKKTPRRRTENSFALELVFRTGRHLLFGRKGSPCALSLWS